MKPLCIYTYFSNRPSFEHVMASSEVMALCFNYCDIKHFLSLNIGAIAYTTAYFGRGNGGIFLDNVGCSGSESTLLSCYNPGIGYHNCRHSEDAGVRCLGNA